MFPPLTRAWRSAAGKRAGPSPDVDPLEELIRILGEAKANSSGTGDIHGVRESSDEGRSLSATIGTTSILQAT